MYFVHCSVSVKIACEFLNDWFCRSPKPLVVEMLEPRDEDDGLAERMIQRNAMLQKYSLEFI